MLKGTIYTDSLGFMERMGLFERRIVRQGNLFFDNDDATNTIYTDKDGVPVEVGYYTVDTENPGVRHSFYFDPAFAHDTNLFGDDDKTYDVFGFESTALDSKPGRKMSPEEIEKLRAERPELFDTSKGLRAFNAATPKKGMLSTSGVNPDDYPDDNGGSIGQFSNSNSEDLIKNIEDVRMKCASTRLCSGYGEGEQFESYYTLEKVMQMSRSLLGKNFKVIDGDSEYGDLTKLKYYGKNVKDSTRDAWMAYSKYRKNKSGRAGYVYELLLGNKPDAQSSADFENSKDSSQSVEAKSKFNESKNPAISIFGNKIETIQDDLDRVTDELKDVLIKQCEQISSDFNRVIHEVISNDVRLTNRQLVSLNIVNSKAVGLKNIALDTQTSADLNEAKKINVSNRPKRLCVIEALTKQTRGDYETKTYYIDCISYYDNGSEDKVKKMTRGRVLHGPGDFCVELFIEGVKHKKISIKIPPILMAEKLLQKCPNIAVAHCTDSRSTEDTVFNGRNVKLYTSTYAFTGFDFYTAKIKKLGVGDNDFVNVAFSDLIKSGALKLTLKIDGATSPSAANNSTGAKMRDVITVRFFMEFNSSSFIDTLGDNQLFEQVS